MLREASETARYLSLYRITPRTSSQWIDKPAPSFFSQQDAKRLVEKTLTTLKNALSFPGK